MSEAERMHVEVGAQQEMAQQSLNGLMLLRAKFPAHHISRLPKPTSAQTLAVKNNFKVGMRCAECGSWHHPDVIHLDYVGHAALTDRLLDADPAWNWEFQSTGPDGLPVLDSDGGLWIRLTVCGVTRLGYGDAQGKTGGNAMKERIGDALRNAAMRFGAALDLWHKGELHIETEPEPEAETKKLPKATATAITPNAGAWDNLSPEHQELLTALSMDVIMLLAKGNGPEALALIDEYRIADEPLSGEERIALATRFDSVQRASLKRAAVAKRAAAKPTFAQLTDLMKNAKSPEERTKIAADATHLPADQGEELIELAMSLAREEQPA